MLVVEMKILSKHIIYPGGFVCCFFLFVCLEHRTTSVLNQKGILASIVCGEKKEKEKKKTKSRGPSISD